MQKPKKLIKIGAVVLLLGVTVGIAGSISGVRDSFDALKANESSGIGAVGSGIWAVLVFTICSMVGSSIGIVLNLGRTS